MKILTYLLLANLNHLCFVPNHHSLRPIHVDFSLFRTLMLVVVQVITTTSATLPLAGALHVLKADSTCSTLLGFLFLLATPLGGCHRMWGLFFFGGRSIH